MAGFAAWTKNEGLLFLAALLAARLGVAARSRRWRACQPRPPPSPFGLAPVLAVLVYFKVRFTPPNDFLAAQGPAAIVAKLVDRSRYLMVAEAIAREVADLGSGAVVWLAADRLLLGGAPRCPGIRAGGSRPSSWRSCSPSMSRSTSRPALPPLASAVVALPADSPPLAPGHLLLLPQRGHTRGGAGKPIGASSARRGRDEGIHVRGPGGPRTGGMATKTWPCPGRPEIEVGPMPRSCPLRCGYGIQTVPALRIAESLAHVLWKYGGIDALFRNVRTIYAECMPCTPTTAMGSGPIGSTADASISRGTPTP